MAYQLYKKMKRFNRKNIQPTQISITRTGFGMGPTIGEEFRDSNYIEIHFDRENNKIGFKPSQNQLTGFTLQYKNPKKIAYLIIKTLAGLLPKGRYEATKEDDMWVIEVPEIPTEVNFENETN